MRLFGFTRWRRLGRAWTGFTRVVLIDVRGDLFGRAGGVFNHSGAYASDPFEPVSRGPVIGIAVWASKVGRAPGGVGFVGECLQPRFGIGRRRKQVGPLAQASREATQQISFQLLEPHGLQSRSSFSYTRVSDSMAAS